MRVITPPAEHAAQWMAGRRLEDEAKDHNRVPIQIHTPLPEIEQPILIVCPTRDRPDRFRQMCDSAFNTAQQIEVIAWVDEDQADLYQSCQGPGIHLVVGQRVGPIAAVNRIVHLVRGAQVYGMVPDDSLFQTQGWDRWLLQQAEGFPGQIGVVAAHHNSGSFVNFPWLTRRWLDTLGWFYYPENFHHCADTVVEFLGDATAIAYAEPEEFYIEHRPEPTVNQDHWEADVRRFLVFAVVERKILIKKLKQAMKCLS